MSRLWSYPGVLATLVAAGAAFGALALMLPVVPLAVIEEGGGNALAGATTGAFMAATVATQTVTPRMIRWAGYRPVMVFSALMLGVPALGHILGMTLVPALLFSALRGVGFGSLTVAQAALVAELVPRSLLGTATGLLGVFVGLSQTIFLPIGLIVAENWGFTVVYITAAVVAVCGGALCVAIPAVRIGSPDESNAMLNRDAIPSAATWKLVTIPAIAICTLTMGFGAVSSFLPAAVRSLESGGGALLAGMSLSIVGGTQMVFRYVSGMVMDRRGRPGTTMLPGQLIAVCGLVAMAIILSLHLPSWLLLVAAGFFGGGFGAVQNEALLAMFIRLPPSKASVASALWNMAFDAGTGIGSYVLGFVAARAAYEGAYVLAAAFVMVGFVCTVADRIVGRHRITEHGNTRALLAKTRRLRRKPGR